MMQMARTDAISAAAAKAGAVATGGHAAASKDDLAAAAKAFEAVFMRQMLASMRQASLGESIDGSSGVDQFREMADARMADDLAGKGSLGIADMILNQLGPR